MTEPTASTPLEHVRAYLSERLDDGVVCPACNQYAKVYRRAMTSTAVRLMIALGRQASYNREQFFHVPTILREYLPDVAHQGGYATLAKHWGLIEEEVHTRPDGGHAGYWRLTANGGAWLAGALLVPRYALLYNGECLKLEGAPTSAAEALGTKFDLAELRG